MTKVCLSDEYILDIQEKYSYIAKLFFTLSRLTQFIQFRFSGA